jgi:hypothetical protein
MLMMGDGAFLAISISAVAQQYYHATRQEQAFLRKACIGGVSEGKNF